MKSRLRILTNFLVVGAMLVPMVVLAGTRQSMEDYEEVFLPLLNNNSYGNTEPVLVETTHKLTEETTSQLSEISDDGSVYTFSNVNSEIENVSVGDVILSDPSDAAPYGFLRKVTSRHEQDGNLILETEQATLEDAFESVSMNVEQDLLPENVTNMETASGVKFVQTPTDSEYFEFNLDSFVLFDEDEDPSTVDDQIVANGYLRLRPTVRFSILMDGQQIEDLYFSTTWHVENGLSISSQVLATIYSEESILAHPIPLPPLPGPITVTPAIDIRIGIDGSVYAGISSTVNQTSSFTAGVQMVDNEWQPFSDFSTDFTYQQEESNTGILFKAYAGPSLSFMVYGIIGPYMQANLALTLDIEPTADPWLTLQGGLEVPLGVYMEIFSIRIFDFRVLSIDFWITLFSIGSNNNQDPEIPFDPSPADGSADQSLDVDLSWTGGDPDGDNVTYDVYFEPDDISPDVLVSNDQIGTRYDPGILIEDTHYYWQIVATDEHGESVDGPVWDFWTLSTIPENNPPHQPSSPSPADDSTDQILTVDLSWTGGDPDGDNVTYDVFFEADDNTPDVLVSDNQTATNYDPGPLTAETHYYWQIIASDEHGATTNGPIWDFISGAGSIIPGEMITIPAGEFQMGCDPDHNGGYSCNYSELPLHTVYLDTYAIDKFEITNAQYATFLNSRGSNDCNGIECLDLDDIDARIYLNGSQYDVNPGYEDHPVFEVTWYGADSYCNENGFRLPTEAEWEKAARGTTVQAFPWGDQNPDCTLANFYYDGAYCIGDTTVVGSYLAGASPYGILDMAGSVHEWVNDWYLDTYYDTSPYSNPTGPETGTLKGLRGGSWYSFSNDLLVAFRYTSFPTQSNPDSGFRCALDVP